MSFRIPLLLFTSLGIGILLMLSAVPLIVNIMRYPLLAVFAVVPWVLGLCGLAGLIAAMRHEARKNVVWQKTVVVLLTLGLAGAACLSVAAVLVVLLYGVGISDAFVGRVLLPVMFFGVLLPVSLAVSEKRRARQALRAAGNQSPPGILSILAPVVILVCLMPLARLLVHEAAILWYGRDLHAAVLASAENLAAGGAYCLSDDFAGDDIAGLNKRQVLLTAIDNYGFQGRNYFGPDPHFGIRVNGQDYWWSFRQREFRPLPGRNFSHKFRHCP